MRQLRWRRDRPGALEVSTPVGVAQIAQARGSDRFVVIVGLDIVSRNAPDMAAAKRLAAREIERRMGEGD